MDTLEPCTVISLPTDYCRRYSGMAFDGCSFYMTLPQECKIYRFNRDLSPIGCFETAKPYTSICYDNTENCFWAAAEQPNCLIYKLNCRMQEIDLLQVIVSEQPLSRIKGLSYFCGNDTLLVAFTDFIVEVSKESGACRVLQSACDGCFSGVTAIAPYYVTVSVCKNIQSVSLFSCDDHLVKRLCLPCTYLIESMVFDPCSEKEHNEISLILLATKHCCYPHILKYALEFCGPELCPCNYKCHCQPCDECDEQSVSDLLESVAMVEAALSHILNAEAVKLQRGIELADDMCELLELNKAVNRTILQVTQLEQLLYSKLEILNDSCPLCRDEEMPGDGDC